MNSIRILDINLFLFIFSWNGRKYLDRFMKFITRTGDGFLYPLLGIVLFLVDWSKGLTIALSVLLAFAIELPIFRIIKLKTTRLRPFETIPGIKHLSKDLFGYNR